jgi:hypothetical protein
MKAILSLICGMTLTALVVAGCSTPATAPTPAAAASKPAAQEQKPADQPTAAAPAENKNAPEPVAAAPRTDDANSVTIKATDTKGKPVVLDFHIFYFDFD